VVITSGIGYDFECILYDHTYHFECQTLCLNKVIVGLTFAKNGQKIPDVQLQFQALPLQSW